MQKKTKILILLVVLVLGFCLARDFLIKSIIGSVASNITGAPVSIGGLSLSIIKQSIRISDFKMYNPEGFPKDILVDIPNMGVQLDLGAIGKGKIHLREVDLEIKEIGMAKNKEGLLNVDSLKIADEKPGKKEVKKPSKQMAIQIDIAHLAMGKVVSKDYSTGGQPIIKVYEINLKKTYKGITSAEQLAALIIAEPLKAAGIEGAKIYGAMMLTGAAALPVAAVFTFAGKDHAESDFNVSWDRAYEAGINQMGKAGKIKAENRQNGVINASINGANVTLKLKKITEAKTNVVISARKLGLPKPEISAGILYQISEELK